MGGSSACHAVDHKRVLRKHFQIPVFHEMFCAAQVLRRSRAALPQISKSSSLFSFNTRSNMDSGKRAPSLGGSAANENVFSTCRRACLGSRRRYHPWRSDHLTRLDLGAGPASWISQSGVLRIQVQEFRGKKKEVAFAKSAQEHQSFSTSGSNDRLLSSVLLPGPHRCADEVLANLPSPVRLPRIVARPLPPLLPPPSASACATAPCRVPPDLWLALPKHVLPGV